MSRRTRSTSVRRQLRAAPALLVLLAALLPAAAMADEPQPVVISGFAANPSALPPAGGTVTLSAVISSPAGISHVGLSVYQADGGITGTDLGAERLGAPTPGRGRSPFPATRRTNR